MKTTFVVCIGGKDTATHTTFQEAFASFFIAIKSLLAKGTSWQMLETGCWIEGEFESEGKPPVKSAMMFYDARDFAYSTGILVTSESDGVAMLAEPIPNISSDVAFDQYMHIAFEHLRGSLADLSEQIKTTAEEFRPQANEPASIVDASGTTA